MDKERMSRRFDNLVEETRGYWSDLLSLDDCSFERTYPKATAIERMMWLGFRILEKTYASCVTPPATASLDDDRYFLSLRRPLILPQQPIPETQYVADFVIYHDRIKFVVECDGHDFHERTPKQAEHDKKRDRALTALGYRVLRFTGREIWRDPVKCASEVIEQVERTLMERAA
jgi:very-short-patch-repair endonuclease